MQYYSTKFNKWTASRSHPTARDRLDRALTLVMKSMMTSVISYAASPWYIYV